MAIEGYAAYKYTYTAIMSGSIFIRKSMIVSDFLFILINFAFTIKIYHEEFRKQ